MRFICEIKPTKAGKDFGGQGKGNATEKGNVVAPPTVTRTAWTLYYLVFVLGMFTFFVLMVGRFRPAILQRFC